MASGSPSAVGKVSSSASLEETNGFEKDDPVNSLKQVVVLSLKEELGISFDNDLFVTAVQADGQGALAKVEPGSKLVRMNGEKLRARKISFDSILVRLKFQSKETCEFEFQLKDKEAEKQAARASKEAEREARRASRAKK